MVDMLDMTPGRIVIRRPNGSDILDTDTRMPAALGGISLTGVSLEWPVTTGEYNQFLPLSGWWRHHMYVTDTVSQQVLAAYPSSVAPQFFWCRIKLTDSVSGTVGGFPFSKSVTRGSWVPLIGSMMIETYGTYLLRHINIAVTGGNIVIEKRQSTLAKTTDNNIQGSTRSVHLLDIELAWGIFDG